LFLLTSVVTGERGFAFAGEAESSPMLDVETIYDDGIAVVRPRGALDYANAGELRTVLFGLVKTHRGLVLDMSAVTFLDSSILGAMVAVHRVTAGNGCRFSLAAPSRIVARTLNRTSLDRELRVHPTREAAFAESNGP
jgi:anti-anti-sigma factor